MAISAHVETLQTKHSTLEQQIQSEMRHPMPDTLRISNLKKQKLRLKEKISGYCEVE